MIVRSPLSIPLLALALLAGAASAAGAPPRAHGVRRATPAHSATHVTTRAAAPRDSARTLDAIHIEGELDVPEVLFITARDQRRIVEFQHRRYLGTSAEALHATPSPTRLTVDRHAATATVPPTASSAPHGGTR